MLFCVLIDLDLVSVPKNAKKNLANIKLPSIYTNLLRSLTAGYRDLGHLGIWHICVIYV